MSKTENTVGILEFGDWQDLNEENLYCEYMETGCYYDTDREKFDEDRYEEYLNGKVCK